MKKFIAKEFTALLLAAVLALSLAGCGSSARTLSGWVGKWNAMTSYFDEPELQDVFEEGAEACSLSVEQLKAAYGALISTEYPSMVVEKNTIKFYSEAGSETPPLTVSYTYAGQYTLVSDGEELVWYEFLGDTDGDYKYLAITFPERDAADQVKAIHYRNGAESFEALFGTDVAGASTLISSSSTIEEIQNTLSSVFEELAAYFAVQMK